MTIDRGGLDYKIKTTGDFAALQKFKTLVKDTKKELKEVISLKKQAGIRASASSSSVKQKANRAEKNQNDIIKRRLRLNRELAALMDKDLQALKTGVALKRKRVAEEQKALFNLNKAKKVVVKLTDLEKARLSLQKQLNREKDPEIQKLKKALKLERDKKKVGRKLTDIEKARVSLQRTRIKLQNPEITKLKTQLSIEQQIARFKEKQAKFAALATFARSNNLKGNQQGLQDLGISKSRAQGMGLLDQDEGKILSKFQRIKKGLQGISSVSERVTASVTRMFTALVFFSVARGIVDGIRKMIVGMVEFNKNLETANLGIAALLITVGSVVNAQGDMVQGSEALAVAQKIATQQTVKLRKEALKTAATFDDLVFAFQTAIAPGVTAGLSLDQVREFAVRVSQASGALGMPQNQMAEEIRSILQGTITKKNTRIATSLGIDNPDIKKAKEAGQLFEFLDEKFAGFATAADETLKTFDAIFTNLKDALLLVAGAGGLEFFENLKGVLNDLRGELVNEDLKPSPGILKAFKDFGDTLSRILKLFKGAVQDDDMGLLASGLKDVGTALEVVAGFLIGIVDVIKTASKVAQPLMSFMGSADTGRFLGQLITVLAIIKMLPITKLMGLITKLASVQAFFVLIKSGGLLKAVTGLGAAFGPWLLVIVAIGLALKLVTDEFRGITKEFGEINGKTATWGETFEVIMITVRGMALRTFERIAQFFTNAIFGMQKVWEKFKGLIFKGVSLLLKGLGNQVQNMASTMFKVLKTLVDKIIPLLASVPDTLFPGDKKAAMDFLNSLSGELAKAKPGQDPFSAMADNMAKKSAAATKEVLRLTAAQKLAQKQSQKVLDDSEARDTKLTEEVLQESAKRRGGLHATQTPQLSEKFLAKTAKEFVAAGPGAVAGNIKVGEGSAERRLKLQDAKKELALATARASMSSDEFAKFKIHMEGKIRLTKDLKDLNIQVANIDSARLGRENTLKKEGLKLSQAEFDLAHAISEAKRGGATKGEISGLLGASGMTESRITKVVAFSKLMMEFDLQSRASENQRNVLLDERIDLRKENIKLVNLELASLKAGKDTTSGVIKGWSDFIAGLPSDYEAALSITKEALNGFSSAVSGTITDALDPARNGQDIKNRWKTFFKDLANTILTTIINNLIKKMLEGLAAKTTTNALIDVGTNISGSGSAPVTAAKGGHVQGFAHGGGVRGFGKASDPRDTVPAWLRPGEYVVRPEVVSKVGVGFMEALNSGLLNPLSSMSGLSGIASGAAQRSSGALSMATGGAVTRPNEGQSQQAVQVVPVMMMGESQVEKFLNSGPAAMKAWLQSNSDIAQMGNSRRDRRLS